MKIKYLGTAAFEGVPSLFCNCRTCRKSREAGGRNLRSRSQALIDDDLLIEFNPDTVWHYQRYNFDWNKIGDCLITHSHSDHLYPSDIEMAHRMYGGEHRPLRLYAAKSGYEIVRAAADKTDGGAIACLIEEGKRFTAADGKYTVLPLRANHDGASSPVIYSVSCGGKRLLYAHDTGVFTDEAWKGLKEEGRYDLVSLDCTGCGGGNEWRDGHMSLKTNIETAERMRADGLIDEKTILVVNHFSHNGGQTYDELVKEAEPLGFIVSYDGLEIEF